MSVPLNEFGQSLAHAAARRAHMYKIWGLCLATVFIVAGIGLLVLGADNPGGSLELFGLTLTTESGGVVIAALGVGILFFVFRSLKIRIDVVVSGVPGQTHENKQDDVKLRIEYQAEEQGTGEEYR